ncbi:hypothetical protein [Thalassomonas sp. M1454]|uniref:hypothetical protein n=1 Tax=Thalassomonas sp. M1454 TaxID=2594477 RepID=UPI00117DCC02|nr:hypothetical protein [Thalassomonas sp. M1454]TRX53396.1 hypothetical protein FNN08_14075 [Thalassomonas sp. M1454]
MPIFINLLLSAIRPITFFLPCAAVILGAGLAAFNGVVDGGLFISLLILTIVGQVTFNLANDYQRAFITAAQKAKIKANSEILYKTRKQMLQLILGCFLTMIFSLGLLSFAAINGSGIALLIIAFYAFLMLSVLRQKSKKAKPLYAKLTIVNALVYATLSAVIPLTLTYYLHTAQLPIDVVIVAIIAGLVSLMLLLSEQIKEQIIAHTPVVAEQMPKQISTQLLQQKVIIIISAIATLLFIYFAYLPLTAGLFIMALPSLYATIMTLEHYPESDVAQSQTTKTAIAGFAYWVLFTIGLML